MILISEKEKFFDPRKPFQSARPETHEEWQARMGGEVLAVVRSGLYLDFRFLDQALSALTPTADERCGVLATDGTILCYQPSALLRLYQKNPKYLNRLYLHTVFHCIFRHLWLRGKRDKRLWDLACDIAVENVIDGLGRKSVQRPLTWVRQHAYEEIIAQEKVAAAAPIYRWLVRQTPGVLRQLEKEFYTDDHRLWPKDAPEQPQQMPAPLPRRRGKESASGCRQSWNSGTKRPVRARMPCGSRSKPQTAAAAATATSCAGSVSPGRKSTSTRTSSI